MPIRRGGGRFFCRGMLRAVRREFGSCRSTGSTWRPAATQRLTARPFSFGAGNIPFRMVPPARKLAPGAARVARRGYVHRPPDAAEDGRRACARRIALNPFCDPLLHLSLLIISIGPSSPLLSSMGRSFTQVRYLRIAVEVRLPLARHQGRMPVASTSHALAPLAAASPNHTSAQTIQ